MRKYILVLGFLGISVVNLYAQKVITMSLNGSYYSLPAKINGVPVNMVFSPSMEKVVISAESGRYYYQNGIVTDRDITYATNDYVELNIRELEIGGIVIKNVSAVILSDYNGPVVLGQSAMQKLGRYSINGNQLTLMDYTADKSYAIRYGNVWLDRKSFGDRVQRQLGAYLDWLSFHGDMRTDFISWINGIVNGLYNGSVYFSANLGLSNLERLNLQCCWYYNNSGTRDKGRNYVDIRQHAVNYICGVADKMAKSGKTDINGVIRD
jgi:hypothetical protein